MALMNPTNRERRTRRAAKRPMVQWERYVNRMKQDERMQIGDTAAHLAEHYTRLSAYLSRRMSGGRHVDAVRAQNTAARRVRQALGYTYADDKITF